jgi:hypothetical protein
MPRRRFTIDSHETLVACKTCYKEIAAEAKTCPNCGARNKGFGWIANLILAGLVLGALVLVLGYRLYKVANTFPDCTSDRAARDFRETFDGGQYARTLHLSVIDVVDQRAISDDTVRRKRVCRATLMLNNSQNPAYRFTFTPGTNGGYYIAGQPMRR